MPKDLLNFLFAESFKPDTDEVIAEVVGMMAEAEELEVRKQPLEKALKELGLDGSKIEVDPNGAFLKLDDACKYQDLASKLKQAENIVKLAELGWVATYANDTSSNNDPACFVINFIDIAEVEPADSDKVPDLEKLVKDMDDGNDDGPEGIGADLKAPKGGDKGGKVPASPKTKSAIKDSQEIYEQSTEVVLSAFNALDSSIQDAVRRAANDTLVEAGFENITESDVQHSIIRLFREFGNWDEIAQSAPSK
jgi:hypothetical protein